MESIRHVIRKARKQKRYTQAKVAELTDCQQTNHINGIELGNKNPSFKLLEKIFNVLDIKLVIAESSEESVDLRSRINAKLDLLPQKELQKIHDILCVFYNLEEDELERDLFED